MGKYLHDVKKEFYNKMNDEKNKSDELKRIIGTKSEESGFFELCQKYLDISLNAPRSIKQDTCGVQGCFQFTDRDIAKKATKEFVMKHKIIDINSLMDTIGNMYSYTVEYDDSRQKAGKVMMGTEAYKFGQVGIGKYFDFKKLPDDIWSEIKTEVLNFIQK